MDPFSLKDKVIIIMGGAGDLGSAIARMLAQREANVILVDINSIKLKQLTNEIINSGGKASWIEADVTNRQEIDLMVKQVLEKYSKIDVLVNAHGVNVRIPTEDMPLDEWQRIIDINLKGTFITCQAVGKIMLKQKYGKIINISSTAAEVGYPWGYSAYSPSKGGINSLTKTLAVEWGKYGVTVNAIAPFFIKTELTEKFLENKEVFDSIINSIPLKKLGTPEDVAYLVVFLSSSASDWINGEIIHLDGGRHAV